MVHQQHHIRVKLRDLVNRLASVAQAANHFDIVIGFQDGTDALGDHRVIIDDQNADRMGHAFAFGLRPEASRP